MRIGTINLDGAPRVGRVEGEVIRILPSGSPDMVSLIREGSEAIEARFSQFDLQTVPLDAARLMAPIQRFSRDVLCTGWNYWDHFEESKGKREGQDVDRPRAPTFFTKSPHTVIGPNDDIGLDPHISAKWDFEAEVGIVIGRRCRSVSRDEAADVIFGYFLANDVSQRDLQRRHGGQWLKGKSIDGTMPMGPFIVTPDELDVPEIRLTLSLNGEEMQNALVKQMAFDIPELIAELSFGMTLDAGDVIITGTPSGIGNAREPQVFLKAGDEMVVSATGLGQLRNRLVPADLHARTHIGSMSED